MHEMALAESLLQVLEQEAGKHGYHEVRAVWLEVGVLAGVEREALRFSFEVVCKGSLADGAVLNITDVPAAAWCLQCERDVAVRALFEACPECGGYQLRIDGGRQMNIKELEVA